MNVDGINMIKTSFITEWWIIPTLYTKIMYSHVAKSTLLQIGKAYTLERVTWDHFRYRHTILERLLKYCFRGLELIMMSWSTHSVDVGCASSNEREMLQLSPYEDAGNRNRKVMHFPPCLQFKPICLTHQFEKSVSHDMVKLSIIGIYPGPYIDCLNLQI